MSVLPPAPPAPPPEVPDVGGDRPFPEAKEATALFEALVRARRLDTRTVELYRQGQIVGGCYTGIGNEATSVGLAWPMATDDVLVPTHRDLGAHLVRGHDALTVARQYLKRGTSQTKGRDSGLHLGTEGSNVVGMISHLAHMMPVAAGIAWAERPAGRAVVTTVGDGSTSLGDFHETLNFAAIHRLPLVVIIINNQYAYSTPTTLQFANPSLADRAQGYGMHGATVDGTDVLEVRDVVAEALERGRSGGGPTLIESRTMRMRGHSEHDDFKYVPETLLEAWGRWDPLKRFEQALLRRGVLAEAVMEAARERVHAEVEAAIDQALAEPPPAPAEAVVEVFRRWDPSWDPLDGDALEREGRLP